MFSVKTGKNLNKCLLLNFSSLNLETVLLSFVHTHFNHRYTSLHISFPFWSKAMHGIIAMLACLVSTMSFMWTFFRSNIKRYVIKYHVNDSVDALVSQSFVLWSSNNIYIMHFYQLNQGWFILCWMQDLCQNIVASHNIHL